MHKNVFKVRHVDFLTPYQVLGTMKLRSHFSAPSSDTEALMTARECFFLSPTCFPNYFLLEKASN